MQDYPTEEQLEYIRKFDILKEHPVKLAKYVQEIWHWGEDYCRLYEGKNKISDTAYWKLELHTGGWSGNEEIVYALRENWMFWNVCWFAHHRGGHYYFEIPKEWK